jgi:signal transduction histidine kinase
LNALQLFIPEEHMKIEERIGKVLEIVTQDDREYTALRKDRSTFPVLIYSKPILKDGKPVGRRGICLDITDLKKTEKKSKTSNKELHLKSTELEEFVLRVSHDLKTPLTSILGYINFIKDELHKESSKELKLYLERVENNTKQMGDIIEGIFDYSSIGRIREERKNYPLAEIIDEAINKFIPQLKMKDIKIEVDESLPKACVEKKRMIQAFDNLIDNAIKYMVDSSIKEISIGIKEKKEGTVTIFVKDTGIGIASEYLPKIFQIFTRVPNPISDEIRGSGIGRADVKKIVETHGGSVWAESEVNKGTTFYLDIPISDDCN